VLRLDEVAGVVVAVVVVASVPLVEHRDPADAAGRHVGVGHHLHAVGIGRAHEEHDLVQDAPHLGVVPRHHLPDELEDVLGRDGLGRMHPSVDPDHRPTAGRQVARHRLVAVPTEREPRVDLTDLIEPREVLGRTQDRELHVEPVGGLAERLEPHPVGASRELLPPRRQLRVVGEEVVGAHFPPEGLDRPRELGGESSGEREERRTEDRSHRARG
jgi:hypothetical protein